MDTFEINTGRGLGRGVIGEGGDEHLETAMRFRMVFRRLVQTNEIWVSNEVDGSVLLLAPVAAAFLSSTRKLPSAE